MLKPKPPHFTPHPGCYLNPPPASAKTDALPEGRPFPWASRKWGPSRSPNENNSDGREDQLPQQAFIIIQAKEGRPLKRVIEQRDAV